MALVNRAWYLGWVVLGLIAVHSIPGVFTMRLGFGSLGAWGIAVRKTKLSSKILCSKDDQRETNGRSWHMVCFSWVAARSLFKLTCARSVMK